MIRPATSYDFDTIYEIINDSASAYKGIIPADRWHEPYMSREELKREIDDHILFYCYCDDDTQEIVGVMGIQPKMDVHLIRHAYVRTSVRNRGVGGKLLEYLCKSVRTKILIGTWEDAVWAVRFYEKHNFKLTSAEEKNRLLKKYWNVPDRQIETSVVLTN